MLGAYPHVVSYLQAVNDAASQNDICYEEPLPAYLRPSFQPQQAWCQEKGGHSLMEDFIMVAEFSELEGPKPLMTIPKDGGTNFDKNSFSVRILAVDHQSSAEGFSISEDAQVVLSDIEMGVFAFVHHLVLFDNTARGFVRPYCIAYITTDQRKLMSFYEELSSQFKKVARYLKYGNRMLFVGDLERHLKDLEYTKNVLLNQASKMRLRNVEGSDSEAKDVRKNAENELYKALHMIQQSNLEIKEILSILKPLLCDRRLEGRFRLLEERAFQRTSSSYLDKMSLQNSWFNDLSSLEQLNVRCGSLSEPRISPLALFRPREYKPVLVKTKKAKRFNTPLRGLHELCSWGAKEGVRKLRSIHEYFKRDMAVLELEKNESRLLCPESSSVSFGQCVTGNLLAGTEVKRLLGTGEAEQSWSMFYSYRWGSTGSLDSMGSIKSTGSCHSLNGLLEISQLPYDKSFIQSASSLEEEFSLLTNHEYYPGMSCSEEENTQGESAVSFFLFQSDETDEEQSLEKAELSKIDGCSLQDSKRLSQSGSNSSRKTEVSDAVTVVPQQNSCQLNALDLKSNLSFSSLCSPSELNFNREIMEMSIQAMLKESDQRYTNSVIDVNTLKLYETEVDDVLPERTLVAKVSSSHSESMNNVEDVNRATGKNPAGGHCQISNEGIFACGDSNIKSAISSGNCCLESLYVGSIENTDFSGGSVQENTTSGCVDSSRQHITTNCPMNFGLASVPVRNEIRLCKQPEYVSRNIKFLPHQDNEAIRQAYSSETDPLTDFSRNTDTEITSQNQKNELLAFLMQRDGKMDENNSFIGFPSSLIVSDELQNKSELLKTSHSSQIIPNGGVFAQDLESQPSMKSSLLLKVDEYNKNSSKLSNFLPPNQLKKYAHQITRPAHLHHGKIYQTEGNNKPRRVRTEPENLSAFTITSPTDFYPHLSDVGISSPNVDDSLLTSSLPEVFAPAAGDDDSMGIPSSRTAGTWKPKCGVYAVGDWINNLAAGRPGFCLSEVLSTYQNLEHVIFSLLSGRPVLIVGPAKLEAEVVKLVNALAVFVPTAKRRSSAVLEWTSHCLRITDLTNVKLIGMCRPERKSVGSLIPSAIKRACTVIDIEKRVITAPPYQGQFVTALLSKRKVLKSDIQLLTYVEWWLMDILGKAFIFFHNFCLSSSGSILYSHSPRDQRDAYCVTISGIMTRLGVKDCDCEIIEHLTELVKISELELHVWHSADSGSIVHPITLQHKLCEVFHC